MEEEEEVDEERVRGTVLKKAGESEIDGEKEENGRRIKITKRRKREEDERGKATEVERQKETKEGAEQGAGGGGEGNEEELEKWRLRRSIKQTGRIELRRSLRDCGMGIELGTETQLFCITQRDCE